MTTAATTHTVLTPAAADVALLHEIETAAQAAAAFIRSHDARRADLSWDIKGDSDFVSIVDRGAESLIRAALAPDGRPVTFIGEESAPDTRIGAGITFIVDPLDGTTNYLHGFPAYAVSIGALVDGMLAAAVVIDIPRDECYTAVRHGGAFRNGLRIHVSGITDPALSLIATGVPFRKPEQIARYLVQLPKVLATTSGIRRAGSVQGGLRFYVGAANLDDDSGYADKVMAEHLRLQNVANGRAMAPTTAQAMPVPPPAKPQPVAEPEQLAAATNLS